VQDAADGSEQRSVGGLELGPWCLAAQHSELVAENEDLQLLGGVAVGEQGEELDAAAERQVGELRQLPGSLQAVSGGVTLPPHDRANQQLRGYVEVSVPYALVRMSAFSPQ
jgi:hypothetical protein